MTHPIEQFLNEFNAHTVGFDRMFHNLHLIASSQNQKSNYPPYNIRKLDENKYAIELAVDGFDEKDIEIELTGDNLSISGKKPEDYSEGLIHQGLASRNFCRKFVLSEDVEVKGAKLTNGILIIQLEQIIPEKKKPRKIIISKK